MKIQRHRGALMALVLAGASTSTSTAHANGRFPAAQHVLVGPGAASDTILLRTTFGVIASRDAGATFHWMCEEALQYSGVWDAPIALGADDAMSVGLPDGLLRTPDGCTFTRNAALEGTLVIDLANDPAGETVLGVESVVGQANHVLVSHDRGATFARVGSGLVDVLPTTVEAAATLPTRVYLSTSAVSGQTPGIYRSDDEGTTLTPSAADLHGATDVFVSGIDPTNPERLFVRGVMAKGTTLQRSTDGAATFDVRATSTGAMLGFAISDDGRRVWWGGPDDGLYRSDDGGDTFARVADTRVTCLRYHAGALYLCADWTREPFVLARWRDGEASLQPLLVFDDVAGAVPCDPASTASNTCAMRWPAQRAMLVRRPDAGTRDASTDASSDAMDEGLADANGASENEPPPATHGCACRASMLDPACSARGLVAIAAVLVSARWRTRRRRRRHLELRR